MPVRILFIALVSSAIATTAFYPSLSGGFLIDDSRTVVANNDLKPTTPWKHLLYHDYWGTPMGSNASHKSFRPLAVASLRYDYSRAGLDAAPYHMTNLILNSIACALLGVYAYLLIQKSSSASKSDTQDTSSGSDGNPTYYVVAVTILYCLHPVHTEAVANISGRAELLGAIFAFLSLILHHLSLRSRDADPRVSPYTRVHAMAWLILCVCAAVAGVLCKETALTVLAHHIVIELASMRGRRSESKLSFIVVAVRIAILLAPFPAYVHYRHHLTNGQLSPTFTKVDNAIHFLTGLPFILSAMQVHARYLKLLLFPRDLSNDYSFNCLPTVHEVSDPAVISIAIAYTIVIIAAVYAIHHCMNKGPVTDKDKEPVSHSYSHLVPLSAFTLALVTLAPASHILPIGTVMAERLLYLPSAGVVLFVAALLFTPTHSRTASDSGKGVGGIGTGFSVRLVIVALIASLMAGKTYERSEQWTDSETLFRADLKVCPNSARINCQIAVVEHDRHHYAKADRFYNKALSIDPSYGHAHHMRGLLITGWKGEGHEAMTEALRHFALACQHSPFDARAHKAYGYALYRIGQAARAVIPLMKSIRLNGTDPEAHTTAGAALASSKRVQQAVMHFKTAVRLYKAEQPQNNAMIAESLKNLATVLAQLPGQARLSEDVWKEAITYNPALAEQRRNGRRRQ